MYSAQNSQWIYTNSVSWTYCIFFVQANLLFSESTYFCCQRLQRSKH